MSLTFRAVLMLLVAAVVTRAGLAESQFREGVDLVRLNVTARDVRGGLVHDLQPEEFSLADEGLPQEVAHFAHHDAPISVVVLFDRSSSMEQDAKMMHARDGVLEFLKALRPTDEAVVVAFGTTVDMLGGFGMDVRAVERALRKLEPEGGTRLYDAVIEAARLISAPERHEKRALLILSDGEDTMSTRTLEEAVAAVQRAGVPVYAIAIELDRGRGRRGASDDPLWTRLYRGPSGTSLDRLTQGTGGWAQTDFCRKCYCIPSRRIAGARQSGSILPGDTVWDLRSSQTAVDTHGRLP